MCTKQPLLEPTRPITFKQVSAGFVCDSGRPRFQFWESPPSASWREQMVRLVQTGSGSLGLKMNQWLNYRERDTQKSAAERSEWGRILCVPGCRTWSCDCSVAFCIMKWNTRCCLKRSSGKASVWNPNGVYDIRFLIFLLLFSLTALDCLYFFAQRTLEESEHLTLLLCTLVSRTPPECTSGVSSEIFVSHWQTLPASLLKNVRPAGDWHLPDDPSASFKVAVGEVIRQADFFWRGDTETNGFEGAMHHGHRSLQPSCPLLLDSSSAENDECLGIGASFCIPPPEGRPSKLSLVDLLRRAVFKASARPHVAENITLPHGCLYGITAKPETLHPLSLYRPCLHRAARKPNWLCTVNFVISLVSK